MNLYSFFPLTFIFRRRFIFTAAPPFCKTYLLDAAADNKSACAEIIGSQSVSPDVNGKASRDQSHVHFVAFLYSAAVVDDKLAVPRYVHTRVEVQLLTGKL